MTQKKNYSFTSESVTEGHPDKMADQISDAILDEMIKQDPHARVALETFLTTGLAFIAGEVTTKAYVEIPSVVRRTVKEIGYDDAKMGFDHWSCGVLTSIHEQSPDIAMGIDKKDPAMQGAGDQGLMFGFACDETPSLMPLPITLAHGLTQRLSEVRKEGILDYLRPDGKSQVTVDYKDGAPAKVSAVVVAAQHNEGIPHSKLKAEIIENVVRPVIPKELLGKDCKFHINETGSFVLGGPHADTGLTGRKIIVDTYGGVGSHGGGAFSGKDPSKVDRSGSYMARYIAKNIVASGIAKRAEVQIAYAIGVPDPVSVMVDTKGTSKVPEEKVERLVIDNFDMRPGLIIKNLDLLRPIYRRTACYGHFGRELPEFTWERTDRAEVLRSEAGL
jgi:S-adenosylmethionine synthetase